MRKFLFLFVLYFFCFDESGYIQDLTCLNPNRPNYTAHDINPANIPQDVLCGYYKFEDGVFVLDPVKKAEFESAMGVP